MIRPLEPHELFRRCDVAGEARVLAISKNPSAWGSLAKLDFEKTLRGRLVSVRRELPTIAFVGVNREWKDDCPLDERRIERFGKEPLKVAVVTLRPRVPRPRDDRVPGRPATAHHETGTRVFTYLNWDPDTGIYWTTWWNAVSVLGRA